MDNAVSKLNWDAPTLSISRQHIYGIQSEWYGAIFKVSYVPIHQYPVGQDVLDGEIGSLVKMPPKGKITKVIRRVVHVGRKSRAK